MTILKTRFLENNNSCVFVAVAANERCAIFVYLIHNNVLLRIMRKIMSIVAYIYVTEKIHQNKISKMRVRQFAFNQSFRGKKQNIWRQFEMIWARKRERRDELYFYKSYSIIEVSLLRVDVLSYSRPYGFFSAVFFYYPSCVWRRSRVIKNAFSYDNRSVIKDGYYCLRWYKCASGIHNLFEWKKKKI